VNRRDAMFCDHANEVPMSCSCPPACYCKAHTCRRRAGQAGRKARRQDPTFGRLLRSMRLGFHWSEAHRAWIRMSDHGSDQALVIACGLDAMPLTVKPREYRQWWEAEDGGEALLLACEPLVALALSGGMAEDAATEWVVDWHGKTVTERAR